MYIIGFADEHGVHKDLVGGKGANLGRLTAAGFSVPPGFTVSTKAYEQFMVDTGLQARLTQLLPTVNFESAEGVTDAMAAFRETIIATDMPEVIDRAIRDGYHLHVSKEASSRVAVRSSGTAEDLAEASFAGLHDTYLDILGPDATVDAVKRCWASLWTARATTYRQNKSFDQGAVRLAVVVQAMVSSDASGVMFTANPLTTNTDEIVINSSWGLGEAIVSGIVTPDEFILSKRTLRIRRRRIADKTKEIVRAVGGGVREVEVPDDRRNAPSLQDSEIAELGDLGRRVMEYYDGWPQDIEWGFVNGAFYLLQSRDVTGVDFTWDEDVDASFQYAGDGLFHRDPDQNDDILWTHTWAREFWTGAITPLFYTIRGRNQEYCHWALHDLWDMPGVRDLRLMKYRRGTAYYNTAADIQHYSAIIPGSLRAGFLGNVHPDDQAAMLGAPFDIQQFLKILGRMQFGEPGHGWNAWLDVVYSMIEDRRGPGDVKGYGAPPEFFAQAGGLHGKTADELEELSDAELTHHAEDRVNVAAYFNVTLWDGFFVYASITLSALGWVLANWLGDTDPSTMQSLISGLPVRTKAAEETHDLWALGTLIKASPRLIELFEKNPGLDFFTALEGDPDGEAFLEEYRTFLKVHGHRGHADRDIWFDRRIENPGLDYQSLRANVMSDDSRSPEAIEATLIAKRLETTRRIVDNLKLQPLGFARAWAFETILAYVHRFLKLRDDERWAIDIITMSKKRCFEEISRRLVERGQLANGDDFYFLAKNDLYAMLTNGQSAGRLCKSQIEARRRAFMKVLEREDDSPQYLKGDYPLLEEAAGADGILQGTGTSGGHTTGTARIVRNLEHIGRVEKDDILICNSTDPGWASVFLIIKGLVIETGGMLAHGACLSREYGLPAVTLSGAMKLIPDGAAITVNGDTGRITVLSDEAGGVAAAEAIGAARAAGEST